MNISNFVGPIFRCHKLLERCDKCCIKLITKILPITKNNKAIFYRFSYRISCISYSFYIKWANEISANLVLNTSSVLLLQTGFLIFNWINKWAAVLKNNESAGWAGCGALKVQTVLRMIDWCMIYMYCNKVPYLLIFIFYLYLK